MPINVQHINTLKGHTASVFALSKSPDPDSFFSGCGDGLVVNWPVTAGPDTPAIALARIPANVFSLCLLKDKGQLLVGGMHSGAHLLSWEKKSDGLVNRKSEETTSPGEGHETLRSGQRLLQIGDEKSPVFSMLYRPEAQQVWLAQGNGQISIWNSEDWSLVEQKSLSADRIRHLNPEPDGHRIAVSSSDGRVYVLEESTRQITDVLEGHEHSVFCSAWSPDGRYLVTGSRDARLRIWDVHDQFQLLETIPAHLFTINDLLFDPKGQWLVTASRDKTIKIWSADDFSLLKVLERPRFPAHARSVNALYWHPKQEVLISASDDRDIMVWRISETEQ